MEKESSCQYAGTITSNVVAQRSLLERGLQQDTSNVTMEEVLAGRNALTGPRKTTTTQSPLCKLDPRRKPDRKIQGES